MTDENNEELEDLIGQIPKIKVRKMNGIDVVEPGSVCLVETSEKSAKPLKCKARTWTSLGEQIVFPFSTFVFSPILISLPCMLVTVRFYFFY